MRQDRSLASVGRSMSPNFCASFDDLAQCYDPQPPQPQQHHIGVMQAASMDPQQQQCYPSADQTRNSNPDMLDTYGHQSLHFGGAAHHQGGAEAVCDMPNGFHALGELVEMPIDRSVDGSADEQIRGSVMTLMAAGGRGGGGPSLIFLTFKEGPRGVCSFSRTSPNPY